MCMESELAYNLLTLGFGGRRDKGLARQLAPTRAESYIPPLVLREANGMVVAYGVGGHTCVLTYLVVVK